MKIFFKTFCFLFLFTSCISVAEDYLYILDDTCIQELYSNAELFFMDNKIEIVKDSRGLILRYYFEDPVFEYYNLNLKVYKEIESFLAKIKNPAIIEVHVSNFPSDKVFDLKKWEISTMMANNIEAIITKPAGRVEQSRVNSIGYGEFLPVKNTPNNGGKFLNRVDIMILCNIGGE